MRPSPGPGVSPGHPELLDHVRGLFGARTGPDRFGLEVELIPVEASSGRPLPMEGGTAEGSGPTGIEVVGAAAGAAGWTASRSAADAPLWALPGGSRLAFEPGGQLELSTPPRASVDELLAEVERVVALLAREAACRGAALVCRGMDPETPPHEAELRLRTPRYTRMAAHLDRIGPWGRRMMRQSAAIHVNLDLGPDPVARWEVANRMVPHLTALFANSSRAEGRDTGHRSFRAHQWRHLDPSRTGCFAPHPDPPARYLEFALDAADFLRPGVRDPAPPFRDRAAEVDEEEWGLHLTTLFPEVRPRGYLELRCFDALPPRWATVPAVIAGGVLYDDRALREAEELLPPPSTSLLEAGGREGLGHPSLGSQARELTEIALRGAERSRARFGGRAVERAREFVDRFARRGRDPGSDPRGRVDPGPSPLPG